MSEADRPGGDGPAHGDSGARLRVYRGGRTGRPDPGSSREVTRRLSALERRVERALGGAGAGAARDRLRSAADEALAAVARARRWSPRELGAGLDRLGRDLTESIVGGLYHYWWRVEPVAFDRVPAGRGALIVVNRGGAFLPYEPFMVRTALGRGHPVLDDWPAATPVLGPALVRLGGVRATTTRLRRLLGADATLIVCPESDQPKLFRARYRLGRFARATFFRVAIETGTPIVPVAVIGAEEAQPVLGHVPRPGPLAALPALPITPTFPWLGLAGLVPFPTKWTLLAGDPLDVAARHPPGDAADPAVVGRLRDQVRERLQALVLEGLRRRRSVFRG
jgi:hypothetical protein